MPIDFGKHKVSSSKLNGNKVEKSLVFWRLDVT